MTTLGVQIRDVADDLFFPDWYLSAVTAFFFLSLGVNTLVTGLIVYKIVTVYHDIRGFSTSNVQTSTYGSGQRSLYPLISILVESGLITFVGQLTQSIMYKSASAAFPLVGGVVVMLYVRASRQLLGVIKFISSQGISTTVVLVRVEMGVTYDNNTTRTAYSNAAYSTNSRRNPIPLAPFSSKLNQSTTLDVEARASEDPYDARSERKLIRPN